MGANPVLSTAGSFASFTASLDALSAPADQDIVLTDFTVSTTTDDWDCVDRFPVILTVEGDSVAQVTVTTPYLHRHYQLETMGASAKLHLNSGVRIPAGRTLSISAGDVVTTTDSSCWSGRTVTIQYTLSGYHTQP
jgi:hypothetical protein